MKLSNDLIQIDTAQAATDASSTTATAAAANTTLAGSAAHSRAKIAHHLPKSATQKSATLITPSKTAWEW
jgi:fatty acid/phospholipid biosynthesis enzyme